MGAAGKTAVLSAISMQTDFVPWIELQNWLKRRTDLKLAVGFLYATRKKKNLCPAARCQQRLESLSSAHNGASNVYIPRLREPMSGCGADDPQIIQEFRRGHSKEGAEEFLNAEVMK